MFWGPGSADEEDEEVDEREVVEDCTAARGPDW